MTPKREDDDPVEEAPTVPEAAEVTPRRERAPKAPIHVVKRDEDEVRDGVRRKLSSMSDVLRARGLDPKTLVGTELGFALALVRFKDSPLELAPFQVGLLRQRSQFRSILKCRQVGFSWFIALETLARTHLRDRHVAIVVSHNLDDAKEKISLIKELHDDLPLEYQKRIVVDSKTEVGFSSGKNHHRRISKIQAFPSKPPRGKSGDVYVDEFAFCQNDRAIYQGATWVISRSGGQFTIGSTPLGQKGRFYEVHQQADQPYPDYKRAVVPWWLCPQFCVDVAEAGRIAHSLETAERVERFGTETLKVQFRNSLLDDFKQECECEFQDERVAFFPRGLILPCCQSEREDLVYDSVEELEEDLHQLGPLRLGFDVGRVKHPSELVVVEEDGQGRPLRYEESFREMPFEQQFGRVCAILDVLGDRWRSFRIDATGIGRPLAERLRKRYGPKVEEVQFTNAIKADLAHSLKIQLESRAIQLPSSKKWIGQLHAIKQKISDSGHSIFDVEAAQRNHHHCDAVWSLALAVWEKKTRRSAPAVVGVRVIGHVAPPPQKLAVPQVSEAGVVGSAERPRRLLPGEDLSRQFSASASLPAWSRPADRGERDPFDVPDDSFVPRRPEFAREPSEAARVIAGLMAPPEEGEVPLREPEVVPSEPAAPERPSGLLVVAGEPLPLSRLRAASSAELRDLAAAHLGAAQKAGGSATAAGRLEKAQRERISKELLRRKLVAEARARIAEEERPSGS